MALVMLTLASSAGAWIETAVRSHRATVTVQPDGKARVAHDLVLKIRGGPMSSLHLSGVGGPVEPLPDASVRRARHGSGSIWPLQVSATDEGLELDIGAERGLRGGSYRFLFSYDLDLGTRGWIKPDDDGTVLTWVGPRLATGVDSAQVTFVVPKGATPPRLPGFDDDDAGVLLLGEVRRGAETDEIELLRAHVATGEPAVWSVLVDDGVMKTGATISATEPSLPSLTMGGASQVRNVPVWKWLTVLALSLLFLALAWLKGRAVVDGAKQRDADPRPLFPGPPWLRGCAAALGAACAGYAATHYLPVVASIAAGISALFCSYLLPVRRRRARGPGVWGKVAEERTYPRPGRLARVFDLSSLPGFCLFIVLQGGALLGAYWLLGTSTYLALMTGLLPVSSLPLFLTGRFRDLPQTPLEQARPFQAFIARAFHGEQVKVELWGRKPSSGESTRDEVPHDEARVRLAPALIPSGLRALEISFDETAGMHVLPCVVIRVLEDSAAHRSLPRDVPWRRGRENDERVALLRPTSPTATHLVRLLKSLLNHLRQGSEPRKPVAGTQTDYHPSSNASPPTKHRKAPARRERAATEQRSAAEPGLVRASNKAAE